MNLTRKDAIKLILQVTNQDDPYWENLTDEFYEEKTDTMPTIEDVLSAMGVSKAEIDEVDGREPSRT